jgi:hypothetical protein
MMKIKGGIKMEKYNYHQAIWDDVMEYIKDNYTSEELKEHLSTKRGEQDFLDQLNDELWVCDSVTGNASGSYTVSYWKAEENLCHNLDLLKEALDEFGGDYAKALEKGAEYCDVTIRCYLLSTTIWECLDIIKDELEE